MGRVSSAPPTLEASSLEVDPKTVPPVLKAAGHRGRAVPEALLQMLLGRFGRCGEACPERMTRELQPAVASGKSACMLAARCEGMSVGRSTITDLRPRNYRRGRGPGEARTGPNHS